MPAQRDPGHYSAPGAPSRKPKPKPAPSYPNATLGGSGVRKATRAARTSAPSSTPSPPAQVSSSGSSRTRSGRSRVASTRSQRPESQLAKIPKAPKPPKPKRIKPPKPIKVADLKSPKLAKVKPKVISDRHINGYKQARHPAQQKPQQLVKRAPGQRLKHARRENPKIQGRQEKVVAKRLTKAAKASKPGLAKQLDRSFGPDETIPQHQAALVAEAEGLPGKTYGQIAIGESGIRPGAANPDDGYKSLFQMTPSVQSAATVKKWDKIAARHPGGSTNPIVAAKQAKVLAGDTTGVQNYYGTSSVTDPNAHLPGGPAKAREKLYGKPKPIPKPVKAQAKKVLGKKATKKIIKAAHKPSAPATVKAPPKKVLAKNVKLANSPEAEASEAGVRVKRVYSVEIGKLVPEMQAALVKLSKSTGIPVEINDGYRTAQNALAHPSGLSSKHHTGEAVDMGNVASYTPEQLKAAGLYLPYPDDPAEFNHFELINPASGVTASSSGASASTGTASTTASGSTPAAQSTSTTSSKRRKKHKGRRRVTGGLTSIPAELDPSDYQIKPSEQSYASYVKSLQTKVSV